MTPICWPNAFNNGPPELPPLVAAVVCTIEGKNAYSVRVARLSPLTMPVETERASPVGEPITTVGSPSIRS